MPSYEIVIRGNASARLLRPLLDEFSVDNAWHGMTRLVGDIADASHLHGILAHLTSLNAEVISVTQVGNALSPGHNDTHGVPS